MDAGYVDALMLRWGEWSVMIRRAGFGQVIPDVPDFEEVKDYEEDERISEVA
jgi:hypothetical protein